ncbi:winged helix-turn-helix domain-containing protein, partial [Enterococcus hirae]
YLCGDLMVSHREGFQKVYDLPERVIPEGTATSMPSDAEWLEHMVKKMISAWGRVTEHDAGYRKIAARQLANKSISKALRAAINRL